jgi:hypothetical protein
MLKYTDITPNSSWYILCVLCRLAASRVGVRPVGLLYWNIKMHDQQNIKFKLSVVKNCPDSTSHPPHQSLTFGTAQILQMLAYNIDLLNVFTHFNVIGLNRVSYYLSEGYWRRWVTMKLGLVTFSTYLRYHDWSARTVRLASVIPALAGLLCTVGAAFDTQTGCIPKSRSFITCRQSLKVITLTFFFLIYILS